MTIPAKLLQQLQLRNDVMAMLALAYSPEGSQMFSEMADGNIMIDWEKLTAEEARAILFLLHVADQIQHIAKDRPESLLLMPQAAFNGYVTVLRKLSPYRKLLKKIEALEVTSFEAKILGRDLSLRQAGGKRMTIDQLNTLFDNAA